MRLLSKKDVQANVISDGGMTKRTDIFSITVISLSVAISLVLIVLAVMAFIIA